MPIFRLIPTAAPDDPAWELSLYQGEVTVRAQSTGEARAVAALEEASIAFGGIPPTTTQVVASAFRNEKLYTVHQDDSGEFPDIGPVRVLRGTFSFPEGFVVTPAD